MPPRLPLQDRVHGPLTDPEPPGDFLHRHPLLSEPANLSYLGLGELGALVVLAEARLEQSLGAGMLAVLLAGHLLEVAQLVVGLVAVLVVDLPAEPDGPRERRQDEPVHQLVLGPAVAVQVDMQVAAPALDQRQHPAPLDASDSAAVAGLVEPLVAWDAMPSFSHFALHLQLHR